MMKKLMLVICLLALAGCVSSGVGSSARDVDRHYTSPAGFSFQIPDGIPVAGMEDQYEAETGEGEVHYYSNFGTTSIYYLNRSRFPSAREEPLSEEGMDQLMEHFVLPVIFRPESPGELDSEELILRKEFVTIDGKPALQAVVNWPEGSGAIDARSGKRIDAKLVTLLFARGSKLFLLTTQNNFRDIQYEPEQLDQIQADFTRTLREIQGSFEFEDAVANASEEN